MSAGSTEMSLAASVGGITQLPPLALPSARTIGNNQPCSGFTSLLLCIALRVSTHRAASIIALDLRCENAHIYITLN